MVKTTKWIAAACLAGSIGLVAACGSDEARVSKKRADGTIEETVTKNGKTETIIKKPDGTVIKDGKKIQTGSSSSGPYDAECEALGKEPFTAKHFICQSGAKGTGDCSTWENCCSMQDARSKGGDFVMANDGNMNLSGVSLNGVQVEKTVPFGQKCL